MSAVTLQKKELKGSRLRCLMLTSMAGEQVARCLTDLVHPYGEVSVNDKWKPKGFLDPGESKLGKRDTLLNPGVPGKLKNWWLAPAGRGNTPNWDLVATCTIKGKKGMILVEAKAHESELSSAGKGGAKPGKSSKNHAHIAAAIGQANAGLNSLVPGWALSRDEYYQLSNRFAWSWKLASLGIPVILVYLGFLDADEMASDSSNPFVSDEEWCRAVRDHSEKIVPGGVWERELKVGDTPIYPIIRSLDLRWVTSGKSARDKE